MDGKHTSVRSCIGPAALFLALCTALLVDRTGSRSNSPEYLLDQPNGIQIELVVDHAPQFPSWLEVPRAGCIPAVAVDVPAGDCRFPPIILHDPALTAILRRHPRQGLADSRHLFLSCRRHSGNASPCDCSQV
jgi:hypothetical protein